MLIPVRIHVDYREDYPVTLALIGINLLALIPVLLTSCEAKMALFLNWGLVPSAPHPHNFITHMFMHGGIFHFVFNMLFLWLFGKVVESIFGHYRFLLFYFGGGVTAALTHMAICHLTGTGLNIPMVGASGAIAAVLGVFLIRYYFVKIEMRWFFFFFFFFRIYTFHLKAWVFLLGLWFVPQLIFGLLTLGWFTPVAYWAHIGGFVFGAVLGLRMNLLKEAKSEVLYLKGRGASWSGDENSRMHLKQSIGASPKNIKPRLELAQSYITAGKFDEAVKEYVETFNVLYKHGEIEEALRVYDMAFALQHDQLVLTEDMEFEAANQCSKYANYELGYQVLEKLHRLRPEHPKTEQILAKLVSLCANKLGQHREARGYFEELENKYPYSKYIQMLQWEMSRIKDELAIPSSRGLQN
ncbi:MAG: rhomboid family intramembrane serine protease [Candidatus Zixiibacteriota bacterium]|jgi:membrane associated rhomboid family serine protease